MIRSPVLILGARSDIARALAHAYAARGCEIVLAARGDLAREAADMAVRGGRPVSATMGWSASRQRCQAIHSR